ncbi:MAG: TfoX/Sxy family protein [Leptolyngbyaceae cyanobacterium bins.302]|nr:TfoX/Sxy family protein [Leptolyngbyaceae cyanobacterium bins.302]
MSNKAFCELVLQHLNQVAPVTARAMFGGYGIYTDSVIFALIADATLYFKVDDSNRNDFLAAGMKPFTYEAKGKPIEMSYCQLPEAVWQDLAMLATWVEKSVAVARRAKRKQKRHKASWKNQLPLAPEW